MSLSATCRAECDYCKKLVEREVVLDDLTSQGIMKSEEDDGYLGRTHASDLWSWCYPDNWIQLPEDKPTGQKHLFFCGENCYKDWLRNQDRFDDVKRFENSVWIA